MRERISAVLGLIAFAAFIPIMLLAGAITMGIEKVKRYWEKMR